MFESEDSFRFLLDGWMGMEEEEKSSGERGLGPGIVSFLHDDCRN